MILLTVNILQAIRPIFQLILTGSVLRRAEFPSAGFWPQAERLSYYVLFPALLMAATLVVSICLLAAFQAVKRE